MSKKRVHELAKELGVEWKVLQTKGKTLGIDITTAQNTISDDEAVKLKNSLKGSAARSSKSSSGDGQAPLLLPLRRQLPRQLPLFR